MAGLCEGGNEPSGSLKAICKLKVKQWTAFVTCAYPNPGPSFSTKVSWDRQPELPVLQFTVFSSVTRACTAHAFCQDTRDVQYGNNVSVERVGVKGKVERVSTEFKAKTNPFPYNSPLHSSRRNMGPTSIVQLSAMLQEEWRRIPVDILHKLVESMPDRVAAVIATRGGTTRF
ncbi:hypothetical protein ANN_18527 [Periplaneta americana]|uniref:Per a allergen n=1 Tax=Periplaneta americana TaxID=6978 RepID=A0ABQ8SQH3_PERAM|nr:hypothetical protein ANN_18527 [Periplaneta americana]